jgi:hypothetical protein
MFLGILSRIIGIFTRVLAHIMVYTNKSNDDISI